MTAPAGVRRRAFPSQVRRRDLRGRCRSAARRARPARSTTSGTAGTTALASVARTPSGRCSCTPSGRRSASAAAGGPRSRPSSWRSSPASRRSRSSPRRRSSGSSRAAGRSMSSCRSGTTPTRARSRCSSSCSAPPRHRISSDGTSGTRCCRCTSRRALRREDYALARMAGFMVAVFALQLLPHVLLFLGQVLLATDVVKGVVDDLPAMAAVVVQAALTAGLLGGISMAISAFTRRDAPTPSPGSSRRSSSRASWPGSSSASVPSAWGGGSFS